MKLNPTAYRRLRSCRYRRRCSRRSSAGNRRSNNQNLAAPSMQGQKGQGRSSQEDPHQRLEARYGFGKEDLLHLVGDPDMGGIDPLGTKAVPKEEVFQPHVRHVKVRHAVERFQEGDVAEERSSRKEHPVHFLE